MPFLIQYPIQWATNLCHVSTENVENDNKKEVAISESPPIQDHVTDFDTFGFGLS